MKMHPGCKDRIDPHELDLEQGRSGEQGSRLLQGSRKDPVQEGKASNSPKVRAVEFRIWEVRNSLREVRKAVY